MNESMKKKKIIFYLSSLTKGGAQRVIVNLTEFLIKKGYQVTVVTTVKEKTEYTLFPGAKRIISDLTPKETGSSRIKNFRARWLKLRRIFQTEQPDVIVSFIGKNNFMALLSSLGLKIPVITSVRGEPKEEYYNKTMRLLAKTLMGLSAGIVLQTPMAGEFFPGWMRSKAVILPNPLNSIFLERDDGGKREKVIVSVGRIDSNKNQKLIIDAFLKAADRLAGYKLILYGEGEDRKHLTEYAKSSACSGRIFLPGEIDDVKGRIKNAGLFVLSSNTEGMPNALMEALALGIPCISTDCPCGGPRMLMEGKENGILVPVGDADAMAWAMIKILTDDGLWNRYSKNAEKIVEQLHPDRVNEQWIRYLEGFMQAMASQRA